MLKVACWPIVLTGTVLAVLRADVPYIPTAKQATRGRFIRLAWPQLVLIGAFGVTVAHTVYVRVRSTPEATLELSSEAIWAMIGFAMLPVLAAVGGLYAAWQARRPATGAPWDSVDVERIGGDS